MGETFREVWQHNLLEELSLMSSVRSNFSSPYVAIDTEYPGFLRNIDEHAPEEYCYEVVKYNVNQLELIQLGVSIFDEQKGSCVTWQINLRGFDVQVSLQTKSSIDLLTKSGIEFHRLPTEGVDAEALSLHLKSCLFVERTKLITFHGLYDIAYLLKLLTRRPLPNTLSEFIDLAYGVVGGPVLYDIKSMIGRRPLPRILDGCIHSTYGVNGGPVDIKRMIENAGKTCSKWGLVRLGKELGIEWEGSQHQAGHDSLLTMIVFLEMRRQVFNNDKAEEGKLAGVLYSIETHCDRMVAMFQYRPPPVVMVRVHPQQPVFCRPSAVPPVVMGTPVQLAQRLISAAPLPIVLNGQPRPRAGPWYYLCQT